MRDLLSRWTSSGTASGSVWNGSISSGVNARPIRTVLVRFDIDPFPCKRGLTNYKVIQVNQDMDIRHLGRRLFKTLISEGLE